MFYHHLAHLKEPALVAVGDTVKRGQHIGFVGKTGTSKCHCHYEITREKPPTWNFYPVGMPKEFVLANYVDPLIYMEKDIPCRNDNPNAGLGFAQYYKKQNVYHAGRDLNSGSGDADCGNEVFSPVYGEVVHSAYRKGWGNHIWIKELTNKRFMDFVAISFENDPTIFLVSGNSLFPFATGDAYLHAGGEYGKESILTEDEKKKWNILWESPIFKSAR